MDIQGGLQEGAGLAAQVSLLDCWRVHVQGCQLWTQQSWARRWLWITLQLPFVLRQLTAGANVNGFVCFHSHLGLEALTYYCCAHF